MTQIFNIAGVETRVHSNSIDLDQIRVPSLAGLGSDLPLIDRAELYHYDSEYTQCSEEENYLVFNAPAQSYDKTGTIFYLAELAAEQKRQMQGGALLHAAGVYLPDSKRGILILGEKGAGKTSTAVGLCKNNGGQLVGNDQIILGSSDSSIDLVEGTKEIHIRLTAALQDQTLMSLVDYSDGSPKPNWDNKKTISPEEAGIQTAESAHEITDVIQVVIDRTLEETIVYREVNDIQTLLFLIEKTSRHIRGVATPITNNDGFFEAFAPSLDTPETSSNRQKLVNRILNQIGVTKIYAPSTNHVIESIMSSNV